ncbi:multicopper oxidase family protein [Aliikangiella sp. IMCC44359]|uniref:multicopper oxidase family protein n=1 Tax=Aliikangiella sp. IMCC44359 TaxID=3459125 RepID=UPI00403AB6FC
MFSLSTRLTFFILILDFAHLAINTAIAESISQFKNPPNMPIQRITPAKTMAASNASFEWFVKYTQNKLWNPTTQSYDKVSLRSYQGTGIDPNVPYVAPTIRILPGETIRATLHNQLPYDPTCIDKSNKNDVNVPHCFNGTNMHTHGLWINPAGNSDNVLISINPGISFQYEYNVPEDHPAGTFWYHPHRHGSTAIQVSSGMAGALIIDGTRQPTVNNNGDIDTLLTPSKGQPFNERIIVLQQIQYACYEVDPETQTLLPKTNDDGSYRCEKGDIGKIENYDFGNWPDSGRFTSINGIVQPVFNDAVVGQVERWRMIHAGVHDSISLQIRKLKNNSQSWKNLKASEHKQFIENNCTGDIVSQHVIAADGLTTAHIQNKKTTVFQPGYRWDSLVLFSEPGTYCIIDETAEAISNVSQKTSPMGLIGTVTVKENSQYHHQGINGIPTVTMQIHPTQTGDTVANDSEVPPGKGKLIVVGFWQQTKDSSTQETDNPCAGEPHFKIAFPVEYGNDKCYAWKHWDINGKAHENSASRFHCKNGKLEYTQWTTYTCSGGINSKGTIKEASITQCKQDIPPELYSKLLMPKIASQLIGININR